MQRLNPMDRKHDAIKALADVANTNRTSKVVPGPHSLVRALVVCAIFTIASAEAGLVTIRSGGTSGGAGSLDPAVHLLVGPVDAGFGHDFTASDFDGARTGPNAMVTTRHGAWVSTLPSDAQAQWINNSGQNGSGSSALYAIEFTLPDAIGAVVLDLHFAVDNNLGEAQRPGIYVNGAALGSTNGIGSYGAEYQYNAEITDLVHGGTNTLYLYCYDYGSDAGLIFSANVTFEACSTLAAYPLDPSTTFLQTNADAVDGSCNYFRLDDLCIAAGDMLYLYPEGFYSNSDNTTTTALQASVIEIVLGWDFESDAVGQPHACDAYHTALQRYEYPVNDSWLEASEFSQSAGGRFALGPGQSIVKVEVDVYATHDMTNGESRSGIHSSKLALRVTADGLPFTVNQETETWGAPSYDCRWRMADRFGGGGLDITAELMAAGLLNENTINALNLAVRRCGSCGDSWLRVSSFRVVVTIADCSIRTPQTATGVLCLFSSDSTLLAPDQMDRVPGAVAAGTPFVTVPTAVGGLSTDISEDFMVTEPTAVMVPAGALYLYMSAHDNFYSDNCDPDGDYALMVRKWTGTPSGVVDGNELMTNGLVVGLSPNPFSDLTRVSFSLPRDGAVQLGVYDLAGRRVRTLLNEQVGAGPHEVLWDGRSDDGQKMSSGVYFMRFDNTGRTSFRRILLLK